VQVRELVAMGPHVTDRLLLDIANEPDQLGIAYEPQVWRTASTRWAQLQTALSILGAAGSS
jgi:hypothetical protein